MKILRRLFMACTIICMAGCTNMASNPIKEKKEPTRKVIIDTDTGADDASAIILAAKNPDIDILGITVLLGNVDLEQSTRNALMAMEIAGHNAPVYKGSDDTLDGEKKIAFSVFGKDGMGEQNLINPKSEATEGDAIDFIIDTVAKNPGEVEIIALGPATNIAKAIQKDPETMKNVKMIWAMGSAGLGPGNASPVAEFNVYADADAYKVMLDSGLPITIIGLDMCGGDALWTDKNFERLEKENEIGSFVTKSFTKIREFYESNGSNGTVMNCDALAMTCALYPDFIKETVQCHASCITEKGETYAQVIYYREGFTYDAVSNDLPYNVTLVTKVDGSSYFERYLTAIQQ